ncbi:MAG: hypothetical protein KGM15_09605 [Pseudomonadota bacterium]|nr:hypothetical protein [Pseudomonadota bacterium]
MRRRHIPLVAALALGLGAAQAEPATPEGAKAMADAYAVWFSPAVLEKGVLAIAPQGDDYVVTWDLAKALPPASVTVVPFVYRVTPTLDGGWFAHGSSLPTLTFAPGQRDSATISFDGFRFEGLYDPTAPEFFRSRLRLGALTADVKSKAGERSQRYIATENGVAGEMRLRAGAEAGTVDVRIIDSVAASKEKTSLVGDGADETRDVETRQGAATSESAATGLRAAAFGDLWRYLIAHAGAPSGEALQPKLAALAPLWREISAQVEVGDVAVAFPGGSLSLKSAGEDVKLSGLAAHSTAALALAVKDLALDLDAAPDWARSLWPLTLALQIEAEVDGLDRAAAIALADPAFSKTGDLGEDAEAAIVSVLAGGHPRLVVSQTRLVSPLIEASFAGEAGLGEAGPQAQAKISADSLDKLLEALAKIAESEPDARQLLFVVTFARGLAKSEDGRLAWDIEYVAPDAVKVNGQLFPPK